MNNLSRTLRALPLLAFWFAAHYGEVLSAQHPSVGSSVESPRIAALVAALDAGESRAVEEFWSEVERTGTPLIEPSGDESSLLVTFLWRGGDETHHVVIFSGVTAMYGFSECDLVEHRMRRIEGTDVWFRTYELPRDARFFYYLSPNDALVPADQLTTMEDWNARVITWQADPLNPRREIRPHDDRDWIISLVELPDAPAQPWRDHPPALRGTVQEHVLPSSVLAGDRRLWIYLPTEDSSRGEPMPLVVAFDGSGPNVVRDATQVLDYLIAERRIEPAIVVWIEQQDRDAELSCSKEWNRFLVTELVPWMRSEFDVRPDADRTVVAGGSLGGLAALCAGLEHPDVFGAVLSQSGYVSMPRDGEYGWIIRRFVAAPKLPLRVYLSVGTFEHEFDMLPANRHLRDVLLAKGYPVRYVEFSGGHDAAHSSINLARGLEALLPVRSPN